MPGFLLHQNAQVQCLHAGQATPTVVSPRVRVGGMWVTTMPPQYVIAGCPNPPPSGGPCVTASWITSSLRVKVDQQQVLLFDSQAITNIGAPLIVLSTQMRVRAT